MSELKENDVVALESGGKVKIKKELGRGGQGIVYLVDVQGEEKALKWYMNAPDDHFRKNLLHNAENGAPSDVFLWPEFITQKQHDSYGYVMRLRPKNYFEFGEFLLAKRRFKSFDAMLAATLKICEGFEKLHRSGLSYQDLNDGNFFIEPESGDVLICDNDNVMPHGEKSGIMGKSRYMAPEIVAGGSPDTYSDRFSLSVILFLLFYMNHPFEGAKVAGCPCLTESYEKKFYGSEALFIYDADDKSNLPVRGIHTNVIRRWPVLPKELSEAFTAEFSQRKLKNPQERMLESQWQKLIRRMRDDLVVCQHCGDETFVDIDAQPCNCINCGHQVDLSKQLIIGKRILTLTNKTKIYIDKDSVPDGLVTKDSAGILILKNISNETWTVETPSRKLREVASQAVMPVREGLKISFPRETDRAEIKVLTNK